MEVEHKSYYEIWDDKYHGKDSDIAEVVLTTTDEFKAKLIMMVLTEVYGISRFTLVRVNQ